MFCFGVLADKDSCNVKSLCFPIIYTLNVFDGDLVVLDLDHLELNATTIIVVSINMMRKIKIKVIVLDILEINNVTNLDLDLLEKIDLGVQSIALGD
jgi:hypothetical protein